MGAHCDARQGSVLQEELVAGTGGARMVWGQQCHERQNGKATRRARQGDSKVDTGSRGLPLKRLSHQSLNQNV